MIHVGVAVAVLLLSSMHSWAQESQAPAPQIGQQSKDSVWVPTPERMIRRMLQLADTTKDDVVLDLGSGDGRIPIYAAKHFGARAVGVELEGNLVELSKKTAAAQGVAERAKFLQQDLFEADLSQATVVALYISPGVMERLKPRLLALKPGTRVVSHHFTLGDWEPDEVVKVEERTGYLWVVPAAVEGRWWVSVGQDEFFMRVQQRHQAIQTEGERAGKPLPVIGARLRGTEIRFTSFDMDGAVRHFQGRVDGARLVGESEGAEPRRWSAVR
jgi:SAM-dependent methyltransferase